MSGRGAGTIWAKEVAPMRPGYLTPGPGMDPIPMPRWEDLPGNRMLSCWRCGAHYREGDGHACPRQRCAVCGLSYVPGQFHLCNPRFGSWDP